MYFSLLTLTYGRVEGENQDETTFIYIYIYKEIKKF